MRTGHTSWHEVTRSPNVSVKDFESFPKWAGDLFTTRRFSVEILNAVVDRQEAEITRLLTRDIER